MRTPILNLIPIVAMVAGALGVPLAAQTTSLTGTVYSDTGSIPVKDAEVVLIALKKSARSDSKGNFRITDIPMGAHELLVRRVGFQPYAVTVTFRDAKTVEADIMLAPIVTTLGEVNVIAKDKSFYASRLSEFDSRRKSGFGWFLTSEFFEKNEGRRLAELVVTRLPGVRTIGGGSANIAVTSRTGRYCPVQIIMNGILWKGAFDLNRIQTTDILGLEFYSAASTPAQYAGLSGSNGGAKCGTIILWTKW